MKPLAYGLVTALAALVLSACNQSTNTGNTLNRPPEAIGTFKASVDPLSDEVCLRTPDDRPAACNALLSLTVTLPGQITTDLQIRGFAAQNAGGDTGVEIAIENEDPVIDLEGLALVARQITGGGAAIASFDARESALPALLMGEVGPEGGGIASSTVGGAGGSFVLTFDLSEARERPFSRCRNLDNAPAGGTLGFDSSGSHPSEGGTLEYAWTLAEKPGGSAAVLAAVTGSTTSVLTDLPGDYTVELVVHEINDDDDDDNDGIDDDTEEDDTSRVARCAGHADPNPAPIARIDAPVATLIGLRTVVDGSGSFDPLGEPLTYAWSFVNKPNGSSASFEDDTAKTTAFTPDLPGNYIVRLAVSDGVHTVPHTVVIRAVGEPNPPACGLEIERVSVSSAGEEGDDDSVTWVGISAAGGVVSFQSYATNLVPNDTNGPGTAGADIFVRDRAATSTLRVSIRSAGDQANTGSAAASLSSDSRYTMFHSKAENLVSEDTNGVLDEFLFDRLTQVTERISVNSLSGQGNADSFGIGFISADGRFVGFTSAADNLVPGDTNAGVFAGNDVFIRDRWLEITERVSIATNGIQGDANSWGPAISLDGRIVAFISNSTNLVPNDTNGNTSDVFVRDRVLGTTEPISVDSAGGEANGDSGAYSFWPGTGSLGISADGRYVIFGSLATNLAAGGTNGSRHVYVRDRQTGTTELVDVDSNGAEGDGDSFGSSISADGRYVAFFSQATNLIANDTNGVVDVFVHDRQTGQTACVSVDKNGIEGDAFSGSASISADGRYIGFVSDATNLVPGDTNNATDAFVAPNPLFACGP